MSEPLVLQAVQGDGDVDVARVQAFINAAELKAIRLLVVNSHALEAAFGRDITAQVAFGVSLRSRFEREGVPCASFEAIVAINGGDPVGPQNLAPVAIEVHRVAVYANVPADATDAEMDAFARHTVIFNVWPLLRADVFQLSSDMGMTPIVLPLLRQGLQPIAMSATPTRARGTTKGSARPKPRQGVAGTKKKRRR